MYLTQKKREIEDHRGISLNVMDVLSLLNEYCNTAEISEVKMSGKSRKEDEHKHFKTNKERREEQKVKKVMAQQAISTNNSPKPQQGRGTPAKNKGVYSSKHSQKKPQLRSM